MIIKTIIRKTMIIKTKTIQKRKNEEATKTKIDLKTFVYITII